MPMIDLLVGAVLVFVVLPMSAVVMYGLMFDDDGKEVRP